MVYPLTKVSKSIASRHLKVFRLRTGKPYLPSVSFSSKSTKLAEQPRSEAASHVLKVVGTGYMRRL